MQTIDPSRSSNNALTLSPIESKEPTTPKKKSALQLARTIFFCLRVLILLGVVFWLTEPEGKHWILIRCDQWSAFQSVGERRKHNAEYKKYRELSKLGVDGAEDLWKLLQKSRRMNWSIPSRFKDMGAPGVPYLIRCLKTLDPDLRHSAALRLSELPIEGQRYRGQFTPLQVEAITREILLHLPEIADALTAEIDNASSSLVETLERLGPDAKSVLPSVLAYRRELGTTYNLTLAKNKSKREDFNAATRAALAIDPSQRGLNELDEKGRFRRW